MEAMKNIQYIVSHGDVEIWRCGDVGAMKNIQYIVSQGIDYGIP